MAPRWNTTTSGRRVLHSKGKEETDRRMKRLKRLHDLSLFRVWFSGGHCRYSGLAPPVDLERDDGTIKFGGLQTNWHSPRVVPHNEGLTDLIAPTISGKMRRTWGVEGRCWDCDMANRQTGVLTTYGGATIAEQGHAPWLF